MKVWSAFHKPFWLWRMSSSNSQGYLSGCIRYPGQWVTSGAASILEAGSFKYIFFVNQRQHQVIINHQSFLITCVDGMRPQGVLAPCASPLKIDWATKDEDPTQY